MPNDGEFGKPMRAAADLAAWGTYIFGRLSGFGPTPAGAAAPDRARPGQPMRIVGERWEQREFADFYAQGAGVPSTASRPACIAPITYTGHAALQRDLADLKAATDAAGIKEAFVTSIAVGSLEMFCRGQNAHYARAEDFLAAIGDALAVEYRAIVDAGFVLQLDDPGLPDTWDMLDPHPTLEQYKSYALLRIEALNHALAGISRGPHPLSHLLGQLARAAYRPTCRSRTSPTSMLRVKAPGLLGRGRQRAPRARMARSGATSSCLTASC